MTTGSMGGTCPACGRYWNARGCTPGNCKSTPEPTPQLINESNVAYRERQKAENASPTLAAINSASIAPEPTPIIESRQELVDAISAVAKAGAVAGVDRETGRLVFAEPPPPPADHPAPWRWGDAYGDEGGDALLRDQGGHGAVVLEAACSTEEIPPRVRALTEAAPDMEALLRANEWFWKRDGSHQPGVCHWCGYGIVHGHGSGCPLGVVLARIDERSKGG